MNSANIKIGTNKYAAFYSKAAITPLHVYFLVDYSNNIIRFLKYLISNLKFREFKNMTLIISDRYKNTFFTNSFSCFFSYLKNLILIIVQNLIIFTGKILISKINFPVFKNLKYGVKRYCNVNKPLRFNSIPASWEVEYLTVNSWKDKSSRWATSLEEDIYHYRGSLTTVLNYVSIKFPGRKILLVGVDLNTSNYFFEEELKKLPFSTEDWTTELTKNNNKHFSVIEYEGTSLEDVFPQIVNNLKKTKNQIYCLNEQSWLVEKGYVPAVQL